MIFERDEISELTLNCSNLIFKNKYNQAKIKIEEFLDSNPISFRKNVEYHYFNSFLDEVIFDLMIKTNDNIIIIDKDYPRIFSQYAHILFNLGEYSKARTYFRLAYDLNPVNIHYMLNMVKIYDYEYRGDKIYSILNDALKIVYDEHYLFDIYYYFGNYYNQINELEISNVLYSLKNKESLKNYDNDYLIIYLTNMIYNWDLI